MGRSRPITPMKDVIRGVMRGIGKKERPGKEEMELVWLELVGPDGIKHSWPKTLRQKRLLVDVENSGWMYTLGMKKNQLLKGLQKKFGQEQILEIRFRIGEPTNQEPNASD
ncbi:MAG: hypothetical protein COV76_03230 [Candidatus Omnitrophica bacterium CG11_big_fil_rev_8_21_14_0_20_64_10]|nr:MAG: hypothetical protein COV76_03230 [Candidatus Omnitrophica bacterium CG11_big_fil_rev_8_21_14_0_20_64_10]